MAHDPENQTASTNPRAPSRVLGSLVGELREYFALEKAEREASSRSALQQTKIRDLTAAGEVRLAAAESLRQRDQVPAALVLHREGLVLVGRAVLEARGKPSSEDAKDVFQSLARMVETGELPPSPDGFDDVRALLTDPRPLAYDELPLALALSKREQVQATALWLRELVEARAPRQIKLTRALRLGALALAVLLAGGFGLRKVFEPENLALGKPVQASSRRPHCPPGSGAAGLPPYGLVDGSIGAGYDICTNAEVRPWVTLDLEHVTRVGKIVVYHRADCCWGGYDLPSVLELSNDGKSFREVARRTTAFSAKEPWVVVLERQSARFVRFRIDSNEIREVVLSELEVYAPR